MTQTNSNSTSVTRDTTLTNSGTSGMSGIWDVKTSADSVSTILSGSNTIGGADGSVANGDYAFATSIVNGKLADGTVVNTSNVLGSYVNNVDFLPTEAVAKSEWVAATAGNYLDTTTWKAVPTLTGNASAFTLNTNDSGRNATFSETISGSPFVTGNGSVNEAFTFRGTANDTLVIKHNVTVANVPAVTNNNTANALDVRNESYAETYAKAGVTSNYAQNTAHKYAEVNGNQSLNDAFAETYAYKDAGLTVNSSVKKTLADAAYINGAENIADNKAANYHYASAKGSVDYVVTDTRNLAQADQRTWTNTTVTNVPKFEVKDLVNKTTITASGLVTGTTTNLAATKFAPTNAKFNVSSDHYNLDVKDFTVGDAANTNALLSLVNNSTGTNVFNSPLGNGVVPTAFNKYVSVATDTLTGTQFADTITIKDVAGKVAGTFVGGNVNAGAGNDTITGSKGDDVLTGNAGADSFVVTAGNDTVTDFALGSDTLTVTKGTGTAKVTVNFADKTSAVYNVTANATTDVTIPALNADKTPLTKADLDKIAGVAPDRLNLVGDENNTNPIADNLIGGASDDTLNGLKLADTLTGGAGADTFKFTDLTNGIANRIDTISDFSATEGDKIDVSALGFKTFIGTAAFSANPTGELRFDEATDSLQGQADTDATVELTVVLTGVTAADLSAADFIFA